MNDIRQRLNALRRRLVQAYRQSFSAGDTAGLAQQLNVLWVQRDALETILNELTLPASPRSQEWDAVRSEFDIALRRLERALERALAPRGGRGSMPGRETLMRGDWGDTVGLEVRPREYRSN